ncbi:hypothetical protein OsJ_30507 [Oryza sativa Japonica Group]|uniref:Uncharacterized protein n=1 Tax=Oryza sativa subsp. japonica TaxID=39947 RepID=B9G780_ORYSJ|nr:hypothetical protein OsJ_30507 [Oryza sativa Japonica Group]
METADDQERAPLLYPQPHAQGDVEYEVNKMVLRFISPSCKTPPAKEHRALHPLDLFRKSLLSGQHHRPRGDQGRGGGGAARRDDRRHDDDEEEANGGIIRSAAELYEAGIRFRRPHHPMKIKD